jgi:hypothetical protein
MPSIPTYQRQLMPQGDLVGARANTNNAPDDAIGGALRGIGQQGMGMATTMMRVDAQQEAERKREAEAEGAQNVRTLLPQGDVHFQEVTTKAMQGWKVGDPDLRETVGKDFDTWVTENTEKLPTPASKKYFIEHAATMKSRLQMEVFKHMELAKSANAKVDNELSLQADEVSVSKDPDRYDELLKRQVEPLIATSTDQAATKAQAALIKNRLSLAAKVGEMRKDPAKFYREHFGEMPGAGVPGAPGSSAPSSSIAQAIYGQESGGGTADTSKPNSQGVRGPMQMKEATFNGMKAQGLIPQDYSWSNPVHNKEAGFKWVDYLSNKYNGNVDKVAAAYYGGEGAVNADGTINTHWKNKKRPQDPTVGEYIQQVKGRMGKSRGTADAPGAPPGDGGQPKVVVVSDPVFDNLRIDQIDALRQQTESLAKQQSAAAAATVSVAAARAVVDAQPLAPDTLIDIPKAKAEAVAKAEAAMGAPLNEQQRATVETAVEHAAADKERDRKRAEANDMNTAFDLLDKNGGDIVAFRRDNQPLLARLGRAEQERLNVRAGMVATGETRDTDWPAYQALIENPAALKEMNLGAVRDKFGAKEFAQLGQMQAALNKDVTHEDNIRSNLALVHEMMKGKVTTVNEPKFFSMLQSAIDTELLVTGKKAVPQDRIRQIADDLLVKEITSKGMIFDSKEFAYALPVPPAERLKIEASLEAAGLPVNDYTVMLQWRKKLPGKSVLSKPVKPTITGPR